MAARSGAMAPEHRRPNDIDTELKGQEEIARFSESLQRRAKECDANVLDGAAVDKMLLAKFKDPAIDAELHHWQSGAYERQASIQSLVSVRSDVSDSGYMESGQDTEEEESRRPGRSDEQVLSDWTARALKLKQNAFPNPPTASADVPALVASSVSTCAESAEHQATRPQGVEESGYCCDDEESVRLSKKKVARGGNKRKL